MSASIRELATREFDFIRFPLVVIGLMLLSSGCGHRPHPAKTKPV